MIMNLHPKLPPSGPSNDGKPVPLMSHADRHEQPYLAAASRMPSGVHEGRCLGSKGRQENGTSCHGRLPAKCRPGEGEGQRTHFHRLEKSPQRKAHLNVW